MYCRNCGRLNDNNNYQCPSCGNILHGEAVKPCAPAAPVDSYVPSHSALAWVSLILPFFFCCFPGILSAPFAIVALVFSTDVKKKLSRGDIAGARKSSRTALIWGWIAIGAAILGIVVWAITMNSFGYQMKNPKKWY